MFIDHFHCCTTKEITEWKLFNNYYVFVRKNALRNTFSLVIKITKTLPFKIFAKMLMFFVTATFHIPAQKKDVAA